MVKSPVGVCGPDRSPLSRVGEKLLWKLELLHDLSCLRGTDTFLETPFREFRLLRKFACECAPRRLFFKENWALQLRPDGQCKFKGLGLFPYDPFKPVPP